MSAERERVETFGHLEDGLRQAGDWYHWGPYLSERQWGTVREDYSADGTAWEYLPHDHARSRAYRWGEDGLAGFSDVEQRLCLALALWNGRDPILKERIFGLTGNEGNHGEDAKEYWWYLDALPSHAWNRWRYHYPQREFPYERPRRREPAARQARSRVRAARHRRVRRGPLLDRRGRLREGRSARPADDGPRDERGTRARQRCTSFRRRGTGTRGPGTPTRRSRSSASAGAERVVTDHPFLGPLELSADGAPRVVFCDNETNAQRLYGSPSASATPKDGINDHVVSGADSVTADAGTKVAFWYELDVAAGETQTVRVRLRGAAAERQSVRRLRRRPRAPASGGRRVLRGADAGRRVGGRGARAAPVARRDALEQAALLLRRRTLARRRPGPADAACVTARRSQRALEDVRLVRHHVDAGQVGVPVVRRVGSRLPLRRARARRPRVREVPADPALPRVVPAPERRARRIRVVVRRRQPAGAGVGGARGIRDRRRARHGVPDAASSTSCSSTSRGG